MGITSNASGNGTPTSIRLATERDAGWWHLSLREQVASPDPPADLPSILGLEEWDAALTEGLSLLRSGP
jgi:hypothetical protein